MASIEDVKMIEDDEDNVWALELEEYLIMGNEKESIINSTSNNKIICSTSQSLANDLPQEVLVKIMEFCQVGRVSKSWSLAVVTLARRKFSSRCMEILAPYTPKSCEFAHEIESSLYYLCGNKYALPRAYRRKARQLLFNLEDKKNKKLRDRLLKGNVLPSALVRMSASDLANPQLTQQRKEWIRKRTQEVMRDDTLLAGYTESDMFECRSCGCKRTRYRQWRRKAIVDRTRIIVMCLQCRFIWEH